MPVYPFLSPDDSCPFAKRKLTLLDQPLPFLRPPEQLTFPKTTATLTGMNSSLLLCPSWPFPNLKTTADLP